MKHETVNSVIAGLGLMVASVTAWFQFAPSSDELQVVNEGRINVGMPLEVVEVGTLDPETGTAQPTLGPVTWKIRVHNETDRVVSIVDWRMFYLTREGAPVQYSSMNERLSPIDPSLPSLNLPLNISAHETTAYLVSAFIPFDRDALEQSSCFEGELGLGDTERCVFLTGKDLFGNSVSTVQDESDPPLFISVRWESQERTPKFYVELETADGSVFPAVLSYFPGF